MIRIGRGISASLGDPPLQEISDAAPARSVALLGADLPNLRPRLEVREGESVRAGQILFRDRRRPSIAVVAPLGGTIEEIGIGRGRTLSRLVIRAGHRGGMPAPGPRPDATAPRVALLERGLWPAFLSRPFGRIPAPEAAPDAIFVTATDTNPLAPDPRVVLASRRTEFERGIEVIRDLTSGPVHVCQSPGPDLVPQREQVRVATFGGPHPSGLAGSHIIALRPVAAGGEVWTIGYQDVVAIGHLFLTGQLLGERVVSLAGPRIVRPRLVRTVAGASIGELVADELRPGAPPRLVSGSPLSGREAAYLGRYHLQVTVLDAPEAGARPARTGIRPIMPMRALDHAMADGVPSVPLMRALSVKDVEAAARLGCRHLVEEDVALLSSLCTSGADYGALLRGVLDELATGE